MSGEARKDGVHHGRLAVEQAYGYMVHDKLLYGTISTFNEFVFLKRESPGILYMSRPIPNNSLMPTIMKILYYFSYLCAMDPGPHPERNNEGMEIHVRNAERDTSKAPEIPNPAVNLTRKTLHSPSISATAGPRRSPRRHDSTQDNNNIAYASFLSLDINSRSEGAYLGCKGWRGTLNTGQTVFAKLWDGWKFSENDCEHEASVYSRLRDLWGTIVPEFLCSGDWGFCHVLLLSYIEVLPSIFYFTDGKCPMLCQVKFNSMIAINVLNAFKEIHAKKVYHGDARAENILVKPDNSVVIVDFERSIIDADEDMLVREMRELESILAGSGYH
jgi:hypothetical protein